MDLEAISSQKCFGGWQRRFRHRSETLDCDMNFAVYLPPQAESGDSLPVLYWLSGLSSTDENFVQKAGAQRVAQRRLTYGRGDIDRLVCRRDA